LIRTDNNRLQIIGKTGDDVLPATAALYKLTHKLGYRDIVLDFTDAGYLSPTFMIPFATIARACRVDQVDFEIIFPTDKRGANMLLNTNWAHLICPERHDSRDNRNQNHLSAIQFTNAEEHFSAVNRSIEVILQSVKGLDRPRLKALEWSLNEVTDNVLNHAESPIGGILQVVTFPTKHVIEFYVCDAGLSIPRTLKQGRPELFDDVRALRAAVEEGVTRNPATNQGNGLFGTFKCCEVSGGEFDVLSGYVSLRHRPGALQASKNQIPFKGTFVRASINYAFEQLLEKALIFKGKPHNPGFDFVERVYEGQEGTILFAMRKELDAFGSREAGQLARTKIENLMNNRSTAIDFDLSEVHLISSSFADEVFGKLFLNLGPLRFGQLCKFKNVDATVQKLIDRAIEQRFRSGETG
jgi:hypothetical protein